MVRVSCWEKLWLGKLLKKVVEAMGAVEVRKGRGRRNRNIRIEVKKKKIRRWIFELADLNQ